MVADGLVPIRGLPDNSAVTIARVLVVVAAGSLGALVAVGSLIAALFEQQGFGDRDGEPDSGYLVLQAGALALSVALPLLAWRMLLPRTFSLPAAVAAIVAGLLGVVWILGAGT